MLKIAIKFGHVNSSKMLYFIFAQTAYIKFYYSFQFMIKSNQKYFKFIIIFYKYKLDVINLLEIKTYNLLKSIISYYINNK